MAMARDMHTRGVGVLRGGHPVLLAIDQMTRRERELMAELIAKPTAKLKAKATA